VTLTLLFAGGGDAVATPGGFYPGPSVSSWTAFLALVRITEDVIRREMCDTYYSTVCVVCEIIVRHGRFAPHPSRPRHLNVYGNSGSGLSLFYLL
jgi:hypothetical protein